MTDPKGNSDFCFPETLNIEVEANKTPCFPQPREKAKEIEKTAKKSFTYFTPAGS